MRMHRHYTSEEIQFVKKNIRGCSYVNIKNLFNERFGLRITLKQMETLIYKHGLRNGIGSYRPGHVPYSKGKKIGHHNSNYSNYKHFGSERIDQGRILVKTGHRTWKSKSVVIWEKANGKVPKGHVVNFADGNKRNFALDNLLLISRKEHGVLNRYKLRSPHAGLTRTGVLVADLKMAIASRKRQIKKKSRTARSKQRKAV